jgi:serine/threonine-protein kinase RsbW
MMPTSQHWQFDQRVANDLDVGHAAIEDLMNALSMCGWEGADLFRIQMAVEEAVVNAIEHGNKRDPSKLVHIVFQVTPEKVTMMIQDEGEGFDHRNVADPTEDELVDKPRGRGVMLMRELMSEAIYNEAGNQVTMVKVRSKADSDPIES